MGVGVASPTAALAVADGAIVTVHVPPFTIAPQPAHVINVILGEADVGQTIPVAVSGPLFCIVKCLELPVVTRPPAAGVNPVTLNANALGLTVKVAVGALVTVTLSVSPCPE